MSEKLKKKVQKTPKSNGEKTFTLTPQAMNYFRSLFVIQQEINVYLDQAKAAYLKVLSIDYGYDPNAHIKFKLDPADPKRQVTFIDETDEEINAKAQYDPNDPTQNIAEGVDFV